MQYKIKFHNINEDTQYFDYDGYIGGANVNLENFEIDFNEYDIRLKMCDCFKSFNEELSFNLDTDEPYIDTTLKDEINLNISTTILSPGDYIWLDSELLKVYSKSGTLYTFLVAQNGTRSTIHTKMDKENYLVFKNGRNSALKLELSIYNEKNILVFRGFINSLSTNGSGVAVGLTDLINILDNNVYIPARVIQDLNITSIKKTIIKLGGFNSESLNIEQLNDTSFVIDYDGLDKIGEGETFKGYMVNLLEILNDLIKINLGYVYFNTDGIYNIKLFNGFSSTDTELSLGSFNKQDFSGGYTSSTDLMFTSLKLDYKLSNDSQATYVGRNLTTKQYDEKTIRVNSKLLSGRIQGENINMVIENIIVNDESVMVSLANNFISNFGLILGSLSVDVSLFESDFEVGKFYTLDPNYTYFFNQDNFIYGKMLCVTKSDATVGFIIVNSNQYYYVSPSLESEIVIDSGKTFINNNNVYNKKLMVLDGNYENSIDEYVIPYNNVVYFELNDYIQVYSRDNHLLGKFKIISIDGSNERFEINTTSLSEQDIYYTFPVKTDSDLTSKQNYFLFNSQGVV